MAQSSIHISEYEKVKGEERKQNQEGSEAKQGRKTPKNSVPLVSTSRWAYVGVGMEARILGVLRITILPGLRRRLE